MARLLDRLVAANAPGLPQGLYTNQQRVCEQVEAIVGDLQTQITDIAAAVAAAAAAQSTANTAAASALAAARESARINSYPNPGSILTAGDDGTTAHVTIANHTRVYPVEGSIDVPDVSITGATLSSVTSGVRVWVYYDDTTLAVAAPTFHWTVTAATAQVGAAAGRHSVGFIDTPVAGSSGSSTGSGGGTPGSTGGSGAYGGVGNPGLP